MTRFVVSIALWVLTFCLGATAFSSGFLPALLAVNESPNAVSPDTLAFLSSAVFPAIIAFAVLFGFTADGLGGKARVYLPSILSAVLLWTAFFPLNWWGVAFVALAPFLTLVRAEGIGRWRRYTAAWMGGLTFGALAANWLRHADPAMALFAWPGVALFLSMFWPIALFLLRRLDRFGRPPLALTLPVVWVALEYLKAHFPTGYPFMKWIGLYYPSGFPWYFLGHTQHANTPLLQAADLGGVYLLSAAVGAANGAVYDLLVRIKLFRWFVNLPRVWQPPIFRSELMAVAGAVFLIGGLVVYGSIRLAHPPFERGPTVAVLQDNLPHRRLMGDGPLVFSRYDQMTRAVVKGNPTPDLVVWPEACYLYRDVTVTDGGDMNPLAVMDRLPESIQQNWAVQEQSEKTPFFDPAGLTASEQDDLARRRKDNQNLPANEQSRFDNGGYWDLLRSGFREHARTRWQRDPANPQTSVLIGSEAIEWNGTTEVRHNSARLILPDGTRGPRYDKIHLVPFGEYVPFRKELPFLTKLSPSLNTPMCEPGQSLTRFPLASARKRAQGKVESRTYTFGVLICYEDTDPTLARRYNQWSGESDPVGFLVNQSLDSWFGTSEELDQHLAISRFRAVEARRALVRSVHMGLSAVIDGDGNIVEMAGLPEDGWEGSKGVSRAIVAEVPLDDRGSVYAAVGDWVPLLCWLGIVSGFITLWVARRKRRSLVPAASA